MTEIVSLVSRRGQLKGQLTRFGTYLIKNKDNVDLEQLTLRKEKIKCVWDDFNQIQSQIEDEKGITDESEDYRFEFEELYFKNMADCDKMIKGVSVQRDTTDISGDCPRINTPTNNLQLASSNIKLAAIKIPTFSGEYTEWSSFHDIFTALVHGNDSLSEIQKFFYLRSSLSGDAEKSIQCMQTTANNYHKAWISLVERYSNKRILIQMHTKALFNLEPIKYESANQLRKLYDSLTGHIKALEMLDQNPNQWGSLLLHLITTKLDSVTLRQWEIESHNLQDMSAEQLIAFLQSRFRMLEAVESTSNNRTNPKFAREHYNKGKGYVHKSASLSVSGEIKCYVCKLSHTIYRCPSFLKLSVFERIKKTEELKLCKICLRLHPGEKCNSRKCPKCERPHNGLLHMVARSNKFDKVIDPTTSTAIVDNREADNDDTNDVQPASSVSAHTSRKSVNNQVLLSTAVVMVQNNSNESVLCRVLLDSGSQNNFITDSMAKHLLLKRMKTNYSIVGINDSNHAASHLISTKIKSRTSNYQVYLDFIVLPKLTSHLPMTFVNASDVNIPEGIELADPSFNSPQKIDMILGSEIFFELICADQLRPMPQGPIIQKTLLGWIVAGIVPNKKGQTPKVTKSLAMFTSTKSQLEEQIAKFWRLEEIPRTVYSLDEKACISHFEETVKRASDKRFVVALPFRDAPKLGNSYDIALRRFLALERRLTADDGLRGEYTKFLTEYLAMKHMEIVQPEERDVFIQHNYLPHHAVLKQSSSTTKLRVVFDAACKTSSGVSLNDVLRKGPSIQEDLVCIMARFRTHKYVISADIVKMYRQIWLTEQQRDLQRILWRSSPDQPIRIYRLKTVTYGIITASYLATGCLQKLAEEQQSRYPSACRAILQDFYMDDLLSGAGTIDELIKLRDEIIEVLSSAGFELRKWASNKPDLIQDLDTSEANTDEDSTAEIEKNSIVKLLGVYWNKKNDSYQYKVARYSSMRVTKRNILAEIASVFDPLGLISPVIVRLKLVMQKLWQLNIDWDETLTNELSTEWRRLREELESINSLVIKRLIINSNRNTEVQIHGFADASIHAYGACLYIRTVGENGIIETNLICAKSRVAPLKVVTLPRLELLAAVLLVRLAAKYIPCLQLQVDATYYWTDSTIVLSWISSPSSRWKTFVGHRVGEIQELSSISQWHHVNSNDNPADIVSRGCTAYQLIDSELWWNGPRWLSAEVSDWPEVNLNLVKTDDYTLEEKENNKVTIMSATRDVSVLGRFSSLSKLSRVIAYCLRFLYNARNKNEKRTGLLNYEEIEKATVTVVRLVQDSSWREELKRLNNSRELNPNNNLLRLKPFVDKDGLLRVGGRLKNCSTIDVFQKHPILLPPDSPFTRLVFVDEHEKTLHGGPQAMLANVRLKYWPMNGRNIARKVMRQCVKCFRYKPVIMGPVMGDLPKDRVEPARTFAKCGIDFAGPVYVKSSLRRKAPTDKAYICVWVCFVTKAVHIELVSDLTTEAFLNALNRFFSRRGLCTDIYSDNATNFVGANNQLRELKNLFLSDAHMEQLQANLNKFGVRWHFIPPRSPIFGGLWEAAIKSVKSHLYKTIGNAALTYEELYTVLVRLEAILNSRPLTSLSSDPTDLSVLTPGHFLIGEPLLALPERDVSALPQNRLSRWRRVGQIIQQIWKRWKHEYLHQLQVREKWFRSKGSPLSIGTIVLVHDDNLPPLHWRIGRVVCVHQGTDGVVRVATVHTMGGEIKRVVRKLAPLPFEGNE